MNQEQRVDWGEVSKTAGAQLKKKRRLNPWLLVLLLVAGLSVALYSRNGADNITTQSREVTFPVKRGDLRISVLNRGTLDALRSTDVRCDVEGISTIIKLVPEGTYVQKDDILVELETSEYRDRLNQQEISFQRAAADLTQASESFKIQESQNYSDIRAAELELEFAQTDLKKYQEGDYPQRLAKATADLAIASEEVSRAADKLEWTTRLYERGFATRSELEGDELAYKKRLLDASQAELALDVLTTYEHQKELRRLTAAVEESVRKLQRVQYRAQSEMAQKLADLEAKSATFRLQADQLDKLRAQLENSIIFAPSPGLVVYNSSRGDRGWDEGERIQEGAKVRFRQTLISLPDVSTMVVNTKIHESEVSRIQLGQRAEVRLDSQPEIPYWGSVERIAILPDSNQRWFMPDSRVYNTQVILDGTNEELRPGKAAQVEIVIDELKDVLYVPNQAVTAAGDRQVCWVQSPFGPQTRPVTTGQSNSKFIEIRSGLSEGEQVLLYPPLKPSEGSPVLPWSEEPDAVDPGRPEQPIPPPEQERPLARADELGELGPGASAAGAILSTTSPAGQGGNGNGEAAEPRPRGARQISPEEMERRRAEMAERLRAMTPEEREAAEQRMRERRGPGARPPRPPAAPES